MIYTEIIELRGRQFRRTWSDTHMVARDGAEYEEAVDPIDSGRTYTEGTPLGDLTAEEALAILTGGEVE